MPHEGVVAFIGGQQGGACGCVLVLDAKEPVERYEHRTPSGTVAEHSCALFTEWCGCACFACSPAVQHTKVYQMRSGVVNSHS